jgi:hypothetical protein
VPACKQSLGRYVRTGLLYRAASLIALNRPAEARKLTEEVIAGNPALTTANFMSKECYRDLEKRQTLQERLEKAGLPR